MKQAQTISQMIAGSNRIVVKIGSALLVDAQTGHIRQDWLRVFASDIRALSAEQGKDIVLVSSGAVALGRKALRVPYEQSPHAIPLDVKQASAAAGQIALAESFHRAFMEQEQDIGLILLTPQDTENRRSHLNARATIDALLRTAVIPLINENDTVSTEEMLFGDNDRLAARVAQMIQADLLILLSTVDGLYSGDPAQEDGAEHIPFVESVTDKIFATAGDAQPGISTGGMKSKLSAARIACDSGTAMIIANGVENAPLARLQNDPQCRATLFRAKGSPGPARKRWIAAHIRPTGAVSVDEGAYQAILDGKSLLPAGAQTVSGNFQRGDAIDICRAGDGKCFARGLANYGQHEMERILGCKTAEIVSILGYCRKDELVHRSDLVVLEKPDS